MRGPHHYFDLSLFEQELFWSYLHSSFLLGSVKNIRGDLCEVEDFSDDAPTAGATIILLDAFARATFMLFSSPW